jgi:SiaC family regulatory phosphoprotein
MKKLYISPTTTTPEVNFSPEENIFLMKGNSAPEDVRAMYYPVIEWIKEFVETVRTGKRFGYSSDNPLELHVDLEYFNSSSAKFFYDIFNELKLLKELGIAVKIIWLHEEEDLDMKEAGVDISLLVEMEFQYVSK